MTSHGNCYACGHQTGFYESQNKRWYCGCLATVKSDGERKPVKGVSIQVRDIRAKRSALIEEARYSLCGCGSGKKAKFCCWDKLVQEARGK
jgi:hypothetical protein